jgi:glutathione S-transferase
MKLYCFPLSPNSRKVLATAVHLNVALEKVFVDVVKGEQKKDAYLKINASGRTPTLVDGDLVLPESNAIMQYIAASAGDTAAWPRDEKRRAAINAWMCWQLDHWNRACNLLIWENMLRGIFNAGNPDTVEVKRGETLFQGHAAELESRLVGREFLLGDNLTLADIAIAAPLEYAAAARFPIDNYNNVRRWFATIQDLAMWRETDPQAK